MLNFSSHSEDTCMTWEFHYRQNQELILTIKHLTDITIHCSVFHLPALQIPALPGCALSVHRPELQLHGETSPRYCKNKINSHETLLKYCRLKSIGESTALHCSFYTLGHCQVQSYLDPRHKVIFCDYIVRGNTRQNPRVVHN